jgi:hypothetical protein
MNNAPAQRRSVVGLIALVLMGLTSPWGKLNAAVIQAPPGGLGAAVRAAKPGDTIVAAPGAHGALSLADLNFDPPVTISGRGAVLTGMDLQNIRGLSLVGLEFATACGSGRYPLIAYGSRTLRFEGLNIHGDSNCWAGLLLRESADIVVTMSEIHHLANGVSRLNSSNVVISDNVFHDLSSDGVNGGGGSNIAVVHNRMTDFRPASGAHPDGIQFWTTGAPEPASHVLIQGNVIDRGSGDLTTVAQGVFVELDSPDRRWSDVRVLDNVILGGMYNGVFADGVDGLEVAGNTVTGFPDMESWIRISPGNTHVAVHDNAAQRYIDGRADLAVDASNRLIPAAKDGGVAILTAVAHNPPAAAASAGPDALRVALSLRSAARVETSKGRGRLIIEFKSPAQASAALAAVAVGAP